MDASAPTVLASAEQALGTPIEIATPWVRVIEPQAIKQFAYGCGDFNPRWVEYETEVGVSPTPTMGLLGAAVAPGPVEASAWTPRWRHITWHHARPLAMGDRLQVRGTIASVQEGERGGALVGYDWTVITDDGEDLIIGRLEVEYVVTAPAVREPDRPLRPEELAAVQEEMVSERFETARRPAAVVEGDLLAPVVRGPINAHDVAFHFAGVGYPWKVGQSYGLGERSYFEEQVARRQGFGGIVAPSSLQCAWALSAVTNWMGTAAQLLETDLRMSDMLMVGEVARTTGAVRAVRETPEGAVAEVVIDTSTHGGTSVTTGEALVLLS